MYSNKENINILTALLVSHGIRRAVVCPGSRNAPIVHNLSQCPDIDCYPVTDERSAGFYALGMAQATAQPVVVCVTSGSALLNLAPAVAEAFYQHLPLVVVSADRPVQWIDQLDGQTLPQPDALGRFVKKAVSLPEPSDDEQRWYCNRLVNEALLAIDHYGCGPVHINVPVTEPLFTFDVPELPAVRQVIRTFPASDYDCLHTELVDGLFAARRPVIVFGQTNPHDFDGNGVNQLFGHVIVLHESLSDFPSVSHFDEVLSRGGIEPPDFILYVGDTIVSKRLRHFLREAKQAVTWRVTRSDVVEDTFQNLRGIVVGDPEFVLQSLSEKLRHSKACGMEYRRRWLKALKLASRHADEYQPAYSQMAAVRYFEQQLSALQSVIVHYANSSAIRLANIFARHHVWCNRGVNGIDGSLSTAAGFSLATDDRVFCVIGDLSFFYDQNALWNQNLRPNLRILLLNNGRGGIFNMLPGLEHSPARDPYVAAEHPANAEGICRQNNVGYHRATNMEEMRQGIDLLLSADSSRPMLLEVVTDAAADEQVFKDYYRSFSTSTM